MSSQAFNVVSKLHKLSQQESNRPVIVRRGVLGSLGRGLQITFNTFKVTFLKNDDLEVQLLSCETLSLLSYHPDNPKLMSIETNLVDTLLKLLNDNHTDSKVKKYCSDILVNLSEFLSDEIKDSTLSLKVVLESIRKKNEDVALGKKRNIVLFVENMTNEINRQKVQSTGLRATGTISCHIDSNEKTISIYTRANTKYVCSLFETVSLKVKLVSDKLCSTEIQKENVQQEPSYLKPKTQSKALVVDTLQERIERRKKEKEEEQSSGFLSSFTSYF
eukprot:gene7772-12242_t